MSRSLFLDAFAGYYTAIEMEYYKAMRKDLQVVSGFFTTLDGVRLRYLRTPGKMSKHALIFVHGLGGDAMAWDEEQRILWGLGYSSVALDLRGHGLSDDPLPAEAYSPHRLAQDVVELAQRLKLTHPILIGHCFGGMISIILSGQQLHALQGLVLVDTSYKPSFFGLKNKISPRLSATLQRLAYLLPQGGQRAFGSYDKYVHTGDLDISRFVASVEITSLRSYLMCCSTVLGLDTSALLGAITVPTLVVCGEKDTIFPPEVSRQLAQRIRQSDLKIVPGANHIIVISNPEDLSALIANFVRDL